MQSPRRLSIGIGRFAALLTFSGASLLVAGSAAAAPDAPDMDLDVETPVPRFGPVSVLPQSFAARVNDDRVTATTWAGYDGGKRSPLVAATVEARVVGRLVLVAGAGYSAEMPGQPGLRPQFGLRLQLLDQGRHGVDAGVAVMYRQDQFTSEGGFYLGAVALERRVGRLVLVGNLLYGQDGEGDDRDGEARLAAMFTAREGLLVGLDGRYRHELWSNDPRGPSSLRPVSELVAGPTASFTHGSWVVMVETGFSSVSIPTTRNGLIALAGLGSCF